MFEALSLKKRTVLLDTDIGPDCDDAGALALLYKYSDIYGFDTAAVCCCTSSRYGAGCIDAISAYYGKTPAIGTYSGEGFYDGEEHERYNRAVCESFPRMHDGYADAVTVYRRALAQAEDNGVVFITIGMLNNIAQLISSGGDEISPLSGLELINRKVHAFVCMAGLFATDGLCGREFNIVCDAQSAKLVFDSVQPAVYFDGAELGASVMTGYGDPSSRDGSPVCLAYGLYRPDTYMNSSYDLLAVHFAVFGEGDCYTVSRPGYVTVCAEGDGTNRFVYRDGGNRYFLRTPLTDAELAARIDFR